MYNPDEYAGLFDIAQPADETENATTGVGEGEIQNKRMRRLFTNPEAVFDNLEKEL